MSGVSLQKDIGEIVTETEANTSVEWKIHDFFSLRPEVDHRFESPVFKFLDALWCLQVNPNGEKRYDTFGFVGIYLKKVYSVTSKHTVVWDLGILDKNDSTYKSRHIEDNFEGNESSWGISKVVERASLLRDKDKISPHGFVKFFCKLNGKAKENILAVSSKIQLEGNDLKKPENPLMLLSRNFKDLLLSQRQSDVVLKVKGREFPAHKIVLEARSSVFSKMFEHDMSENRSGVVDITDFEPEVFEHVLCYIYSGEIVGFTPENICQFYKAADKYDLGKLKEKCAEYIESNVTMENVCEVLLLSDMHEETKLKDLVQDFIVQNKLEVLASESWQLFVLENKSLAYETHESIIVHFTIKSVK